MGNATRLPLALAAFGIVMMLAGCGGTDADKAPSDGTPTSPPLGGGEPTVPDGGQNGPPDPEGPPSERDDPPIAIDPLAELNGLAQLTPDNVADVLTAVSAGLRIDSLLSDLDKLFEIERDLASGALPMERLDVPEGADHARAHRCPGAGRYLATPGPAGGWNGHFVFDACLIADRYYNGEYRVEGRTQDGSSPARVRLTADALSISLLGTRSGALWGSVEQQHDTRGDRADARMLIENLRHTELVFQPGAIEPTLAGLLQITAETVRHSTEITVPGATFERLRDATGDGTDRWWIAQPATIVRATGPLATSVRLEPQREPQALRSVAADGPHTIGTLELSVSGSEGNRIKLSADNGDPESVDVIIGEPAQAIVALTLPWSELGDTPFRMPGLLTAILATDD